MTNLLTAPWPWYVGGPLIGLMVPLLLLVGNRTFGISAILLPDAAKPGFFRYDWRKERWNLMFAAGLLLGGLLAGLVFANPEPTHLSVRAIRSMHDLGVTIRPGLLPAELLDLHRPVVWLILSLSGLLVGFGTRLHQRPRHHRPQHPAVPQPGRHRQLLHGRHPQGQLPSAAAAEVAWQAPFKDFDFD
ncbi:YeeE/YedE family protein [Deinococcus sp. UYEF24]